jgi:hypothetical protein
LLPKKCTDQRFVTTEFVVGDSDFGGSPMHVIAQQDLTNWVCIHREINVDERFASS